MQELSLPGLTVLRTLSGTFVCSIQSGYTPNTGDTLTIIMDSIALLCNGNNKLNMKRRELTKPELNLSYIRLVKEEIQISDALFGMTFRNTCRRKNRQMLAHQTRATRPLSRGLIGYTLQSRTQEHQSTLSRRILTHNAFF